MHFQPYSLKIARQESYLNHDLTIAVVIIWVGRQTRMVFGELQEESNTEQAKTASKQR